MGRQEDRQRDRKTKSTRKCKIEPSSSTSTTTTPNDGATPKPDGIPNELKAATKTLGGLMEDIKTAYKMSSSDGKTPFQIPMSAADAEQISLTPAETTLLEKLLSLSFTKTKEEEEPETLCAGCEKSATLRCTGCRKVFYCDRECQKKHWKDHQHHCRPFTVGKGRDGSKILIASRDIPRDEVIIEEPPLVMGPRQDTDPVCLTCYKRISGSYRCTKCSWPMCGPKCENNEIHRPECDITKKAGLTIDFEHSNHLYEVVTALRCLVLASEEPKKWSSGSDRLTSRYKLLAGSSQFHNNKDNIIPMLKDHFKIKHLANVDTSSSALHRMLGLLQNNSLPVKTSYGEVQGLFPMGSLMTHSCTPNTKVNWNKSSELVAVSTTEPIAKGERITTLLTDILWGTRARRDHLEIRGIDCDCKRCQDPSELGTNFSALICQKCEKRTPVLPADPLRSDSIWKCKTCSYQISSEEVLKMTLTLGSDIGNALSNPSIESLEELQAKWLKYVHKNHYHIHALRHSLLQLYGRSEDKEEVKSDSHWAEIEKKEKACKDFLKICSQLDPALANTLTFVGLTFYEHHKTILQNGKKLFAESAISTDQLKKRVLLSKALLKKSMDIFKNEEEGTPEGQLFTTCQEESIAIGKWMMSVGLA